MIIAQLLLFLFLNFILLLSSRLALNCFDFQSDSVVKRVLTTATIFFSLIVLIQILLGIAGLLSFPAVVIFSILISLPIFFHQRKYLKNMLKSIKIPNLSLEKSENILLLCLLAPALSLFAFRLFDALFQIPFDFDAISYHLPIVVEWIQSKSIFQPYYSVFTGPVGHYPSNVELIYSWTMLPFRNDYFVDLVNFPIYGLLIMTIYGICQNLNFSKIVSIVSAAIVLYVPVFMHQAGLIFVDLFFILTFALGIYFFQELLKEKSKTGNAIFAGLALGLFVGTKYLGIIYVAPLIILFLLLAWKSKKPVSSIGNFAAGLFLTGAFFYLRNWVQSGNPLYPAEISIGDYSIFSGYPAANKLIEGSSIWEHLGEMATYKQFLSDFFVVGDLTGILVLAGFAMTFFHLVYRLIKRDKLKKLYLPILTLLGGVFYLFSYIKAPYTQLHMIYNIRYMMPLLLIGVINFGYLMDYSEKYKKAIFILLFFAFFRTFIYAIYSPGFKLILNFEILSLYQLQLGLFLMAIFLYLFAFTVFQSRYIKITAMILATAISIFLFNFTYLERENLASYYADRWYPEGNLFWGEMQSALWFNENAQNAKIAYSGSDFHYHLFGRNLQREVDYVNLDGCAECSFTDYDQYEDLLEHDANYQNWLRSLNELEKDYLVLRDSSPEYSWVKSAPEQFQFVKNYDRTYIFELRNDQ